MIDSKGPSIAEALRLYYRKSRLAADGGRFAQTWNLVSLGTLHVKLSNFAWRKRAIVCHDIHHLLTGYPCTIHGELQIAAWEFAAGRFPSASATLFCLPLVAMGAVALPRASFAAYVRGRHSKTLYSRVLSERLLMLSVQDLQKCHLPPTQATATWRDRVAYAALAGISFGLIIGPPLILTGLMLGGG
jgi:hypothetical protein